MNMDMRMNMNMDIWTYCILVVQDERSKDED